MIVYSNNKFQLFISPVGPAGHWEGLNDSISPFVLALLKVHTYILINIQNADSPTTTNYNFIRRRPDRRYISDLIETFSPTVLLIDFGEIQNSQIPRVDIFMKKLGKSLTTSETN